MSTPRLSLEQEALHDKPIVDLAREFGEPVDDQEYCGGPLLYFGRRVRDFYEQRLRPIPCSERMPEEGERVLVYAAGSENWFMAKRVGSQFGIKNVTHWLPMPPNP